MTRTLATFLLSLSLFASGQETLIELTEEIDLAVKANSTEKLEALFYDEGEETEVSKAYKLMLGVLTNEEFNAEKAIAHKVEDHTPPMELPGNYMGKDLEYLVKPTHWILIKLKNEKGGAKMKFTITLPATQVEETWKIPGIKFKGK